MESETIIYQSRLNLGTRIPRKASEIFTWIFQEKEKSSIFEYMVSFWR